MKKTLSVTNIYATHYVVMVLLNCIFVTLSLSIGSQATNWNLTSTSMITVFNSFDDDKFMFTHSPGLYVCERDIHQKSRGVPSNLLLGTGIVQILFGSFDETYVRTFGVHETEFNISTVYRSTTFTLYGWCLVSIT